MTHAKTPTENVYAGIDIARGAWVVVLITDTGFAATHHAATLTALTDVLSACHTIAIDVPVGLSDTGVRVCDLACREVLGSRRSSLFLTPTRHALSAPTHADATRVNRDVTGQGVSMQAYGLRHKIFDAHTFLTATGITLHETHPETAFAVLAGAPLATSKTTWAGMRQRETLLKSHGIMLDACLPVGAKVGVDDMLDAAVAAVTARRIAHGDAVTFGDGTIDQTTGVAQWIYV